MKYLAFIAFALFFTTCTSIIKGTVAPNQCKKCEVINNVNGKSIQVFEGCGSENVRLEEKAKVAAFDHSQNGGLCDLDVVCTTWRKDPEE